MIDPELVHRKMVLIGKDLEELITLAGLSEAQYLADSRNEVLAERYLERMIGRMIDINFHLLIESGQAPPPDYYQSFLRLSDMGVFDRDFAERIAQAAGLRNRIAHEYDELDAAIVYRALQSAIVDIPEYMRSIEAHIS